MILVPVLQHIGYDGIPVPGISRELGIVPAMMGECTGDEVCSSPDGEGKTRDRPGQHGPAQPFHHLTEVVGAGDSTEEKTFGYPIQRVLSMPAPHVPQYAVGYLIDDESTQKEHATDEETSQPSSKP